MKAPLFQRADLWLRHLLPFAMTLLLILIDAVPLRLPGFAAVAPLLPYIGIYYWSIYRPDLLPAAAIFLLGILNDIVAGTPLGVSPLVYLLIHGLLAGQRKFFTGKSFLVSWWGFGLVASGAILLEWGLVSLLFSHMVDFRPVLVELVITVCLYPPASWLFARSQLAVLRRA